MRTPCARWSKQLSIPALLCVALLIPLERLPGEEPSNAQPPSAEQLDFFEKRIRPVLVAQCQSCHSVEAQSKGQLKGGLLVDSRAGLLQGGDSGPAVTPGAPEKSLLLGALRYQDFEMPPKGKLPDAVVADFERWIKQGAADPRVAVGSPRRAAIDVEAGRRHWAYRPPVRLPPPTVENRTWPLGAIDAFVLSALDSRRMKPATDVPRFALVRRLHYDLIGLPPSPDDVDAFAADSAPDAPQRLVDRLLASPRFGERWGRHWLDVARYGESLTLRGFILPEAWRYRDYVIETFNVDRPYDRFLIEQMAGDLLPAADLASRQRQLVATTFLVLGNTNLEEQDKKQLRMDVVDEQLETIGKAVLAQTLGCARCHDHKFDPIPTRDYYAMAGILRSTKTLEHANVSKWLEFPLPVEPVREEMFKRHESAVAALQDRIKALRDAAKVASSQSDTGGGKSAIVAAKDLPGIVLDDSQAKKVGVWKESQFTARYIGDGYVHDLDTGKGDKTITFQPELPKAGVYEVRLAYTPGGNRATNVPVTVFSADGEKSITVNQKETPPIDGRFVSLGQFRFEMNGQGFVIVSNEGTSGHVIVDAVQFLAAEGRDAGGASQQPATTSTPSKPDTTATGAAERGKAAADLREAEIKRLEDELKQLTAAGPRRPMYMSVKEEDSDELGDTQVHVRGVVHNLGDTVPRGFLQVASYGPRATIPLRESGRLEFGQWLASPHNPLTARVLANRIWHWLHGAGIVRTTDNFGTTGEAPSHAELLDHLALRLVDHDWSVKSLTREIVLSRTYQLADTCDAATQAADPENRLLARAHPRRLDAEALLDTMLSVGGSLRFELGGSTIAAGTTADYGYQHDTPRRAVYWPVLRNSLPDLFEAFDFADPSMVTGRRSTSTVAPQALFLMNHPFVLAQSRLAADRLLSESLDDDSQRVRRAYRLALGRGPSDREEKLARDYLASSPVQDDAARRRGWAQLFQVLFSSLDFRYQ